MLLTERLAHTLCSIIANAYINLGETVKTGVRGRVHCFPYISEDPVGPMRTDEQTCEHAKKALSDHSPVCGMMLFCSQYLA